ncbi:MAG: nucleoside phosphorylase [Rikenellaceae bacterium]|nr:nucleoside phosphorylase [Rikenellaceae bacterium]
MRTIPASELIVNGDGTVFHLHMRPDQLAQKVILVGDPGRVPMVSGRFSEIECSGGNREFVWATGRYRNDRMTVLSTGIGSDNIDIVMNELDALVNVDLETRRPRSDRNSLTIVRLGTSGALQADIELGSFVMSSWSIGIDPLARFYKGAGTVCATAVEEAFMKHMSWPANLSRPYVIESSSMLRRRFEPIASVGFTLSAPGFYAPQGRWLTLEPEIADFIPRLESFEYNGRRITNIEMESSSIGMLSALMGHQAITVCLIIAQRHAQLSDVDYTGAMDTMVASALACLAD